MVQKQYKIDGMSCQSCATRLEKVLGKKDGVAQAQVNFATETLNLELKDGHVLSDDVLGRWVTAAGFTLQAMPEASEQNSDTAPVAMQFIQKNWLLLLLALPFFVGMAGMMVGVHALMPPVWLQFILASVVQFWVARPFYQGAWASIQGKLANMDVLVVLGTLAIWAYSSYVFFTHGAHAIHHVYFEAGVMIITFMSLGKFIEHHAKREGLDSIGLLLKLTPHEVTLKDGAGLRRIVTDDVQVGQILLAKHHDRIALDGVVVQGAGYCDESHLTGESAPVAKTVGDTLLAGALVSSGMLEYQVSADSTNTHLRQMIDELMRAQGSKAAIARIADRAAGVFVPVVVAIALVTFFVNLSLVGVGLESALMRAVAVLVIACPCALGLATPTAIMAGMGLAARFGVWFKDAVSLERSGKIDTVIFDKTGTLTTGKPKLVAHALLDGSQDIDCWLPLLAAVERYANHPLAAVLVDEAQKRGLSIYDAADIETVAGMGVTGWVAGQRIKVGKPAFVNYPVEQIPNTPVWTTATLVAMSVDDVPVLILALADSPKADAKALIKTLQDDGLMLVMMSGDKASVVAHAADTLGIEHYMGDMSPQDKAREIKALQQKGRQVAMIGDGINDALAMTEAHSSFAVANATEVAKHTSAAVLMGESLLGAFYAKKIAERTLTTIQQNLFFAFCYNIIGIPLAAAGLLTPMFAAIAMTASSLFVVGNAIRLKRLNLARAYDG